MLDSIYHGIENNFEIIFWHGNVIYHFVGLK